MMVLFKKIAATGKYHDPQAIPDVVAYINFTANTYVHSSRESHMQMAQSFSDCLPTLGAAVIESSAEVNVS